MDADARLNLILTKVKRAEEHVVNLQKAVASFLGRDPYKIATHHERQTGQFIYYISAARPIPDSIALIAGDAIHNARSALDYLAYHLALIGAGKDTDSKWTGRFLCERCSKEFEARIKGAVKGWRQDAVDFFRTIESYKGGKGEPFWVLNELNNADKHRLIITVATLLHKAAVPIPVEITDPRVMCDFAEIQLTPRIRQALKPGDPLIAIKAKEQQNLKFTFEIALCEPQIVQTQSLVETIQQLVDLVRATVPRFRPFLS